MVVSLGELIAFISIGLVIVGLIIKNINSQSVQRKQLYVRLDADRLKAENTFVSKDICRIQHQFIKETLDELKLFMKEISGVLDEVKGRLK